MNSPIPHLSDATIAIRWRYLERQRKARTAAIVIGK